ncbi:hypothetical protein ACTTAK_18320 (plasmid) [Rhodobacter capsulatus]|uniref:hypothetical protein n=1 Tax=Rhodobacter capsulatus TaxID=1061 RepID=UPI001141B53B|nr:hypothetical protein [Rhodobacter capsulatus]TQD33287.1 hypothetical protein FKW81_14930 [Rhodobacter capsulatus]
MRIRFRSMARPKKAAKLLGAASGLSLSHCQGHVARACGYRDWHDLEQRAGHPGDAVDQQIPLEIEIGIIATLSQELRLAAGDVQHALMSARLFGAEAPDLRHVIEVRRRLFVQLDIPPARRGEPGWVVETKIRGRKPQPAIVRSQERAVWLITHSTDSTLVADFEITKPRHPLPMFIPLRLYLPYGVWTEGDGAEVLFSRNYCPMWRLREGQAPERLDPWERISHRATRHLWEENGINWARPNLEAEAIGLLEGRGVRTLPRLVEALPVMIGKNCGIDDAVEELEARQAGRPEPLT